VGAIQPQSCSKQLFTNGKGKKKKIKLIQILGLMSSILTAILMLIDKFSVFVNSIETAYPILKQVLAFFDLIHNYKKGDFLVILIFFELEDLSIRCGF
jgi:hypothetical protein